MRASLTAIVTLASGCSSILGIGTFAIGDAGGGGGGGGDAADAPHVDALDASIDAGANCYGPNGWQVCLAAPPTTPVTLATPFSTDTSSACLTAQPASWSGAGQPSACIVVGTNISGVGAVTVTGSRPLVLVASNVISISSVLAGGSDTTDGPGAPSSACGAFTATPSSSSNGGGGAAGSSFMIAGGNGGVGDSSGTAGGAPAPNAVKPAVLRGGCDGQTGGGGGVLGGAGGVGGKAGGAVYLVAGSSIAITGDLTVGGAGGRGGGASGLGGGGGAGGGGGGTGGSIVLFAPSIVATNARLCANGGGGGGGASGNNAGSAGSAAAADSPMMAAAGGQSGSGGGKGRGGTGSVGNSPGSDGGDGQGNAGGGGGGGGGYIRANVALANATVSPPLDVVP